MAGEAYIIGTDWSEPVEPSARFSGGIVYHCADQPARRLVKRAGALQSWISLPHLGVRTDREGNVGKLSEAEHAGAIAVIDVVIVVGDVVGERCELGFDRRVSVEREILLGAIAEDGLRRWLAHIAAHERAVVLDEPFERLPGEIESVEARIFPLKLGYHPQGLGVVIEAALALHDAIQSSLAGVAEGRMTKVMRKRQSLGEVLVDVQRARHRAGDLRYFEAVGQPRAVVIALVIDEDLRLVG